MCDHIYKCDTDGRRGLNKGIGLDFFQSSKLQHAIMQA